MIYCREISHPNLEEHVALFFPSVILDLKEQKKW